MDERAFYAEVAERAALSKEEAADLSRATLETIAGQISGGAVSKFAETLPDWLAGHLPRHNGSAHPMALADCIVKLSRRTGLNEDETRRGVAAVLTVLGETVDRPHLDHALALLPHEYRQLAAA